MLESCSYVEAICGDARSVSSSVSHVGYGLERKGCRGYESLCVCNHGARLCSGIMLMPLLLECYLKVNRQVMPCFDEAQCQVL